MKAIEEKLDYTFRDQELLVNALTHSSYANENRGHSCESNERLEFLGDSVLGFVVADALYRRESELPEGRMTRVRAQLVCEDSRAWGTTSAWGAARSTPAGGSGRPFSPTRWRR